jgi:CheY-like chemotaxis protein
MYSGAVTAPLLLLPYMEQAPGHCVADVFAMEHEEYMPRVMVVDDVSAIRDLVSRLLQREGFDTTTASSGKEALEGLATSKPDVMLLDLMMPEMDGIAVLEQLRSDPRWKGLPVIMMTAVSEDSFQSRAMQLGARGYLIKPRFTIAQVMEIVRNCLAEREEKQLPN